MRIYFYGFVTVNRMSFCLTLYRVFFICAHLQSWFEIAIFTHFLNPLEMFLPLCKNRRWYGADVLCYKKERKRIQTHNFTTGKIKWFFSKCLPLMPLEESGPFLSHLFTVDFNAFWIVCILMHTFDGLNRCQYWQWILFT